MTTDGAAPAGAEVTPASERPMGFRETLRAARNWHELRNTPYGLRPLLFLVWAGLFLNMQGAIGGVAFREVLRDLDFEFAGYIRYLQFVGFVSTFAVIGIAHYADRHRRVPMVGLGILLGGVSTGFVAAAGSPLSYGTASVVAATVFAFALVPVASLLADYYPVHVRGKVFALLGLATTLPGTVVPKLAGEAVEAWGWRPLYLLLSIPVSLVGLAALVFLREPVRGYMERRALGADEHVAARAEEPVSLGEAWRTIFGIRTIRRLFIASAVTAPATFLFATLSTAFFFERYGLDESEIGTVSSISALLVVPAIYVSGGVVDTLMKYRPTQLLTWYSLFSLLGVIPLLLYIAGPPLWVLVAANGIFNFAGALVGPAITLLYLQITPAHMRNVAAALQGLAGITAPIGGIFVAATLQSYGLRGGMLMLVPFLLVGGLVVLSAAPLFALDLRSAMASNLASEQWREAQAVGRGKLLVCRDLDVAYDGVQVLFGVDFDIEEGGILALLGTNGAGKSTLLRAIAGATPASSGGIVFDGRDITYMPPHETAARGVILMPGGRGIFPGLTVRDNLMLGTWMDDHAATLGARMAEVFEIFPALAARADTPAGSLSGGEQQQLSLAQAFLCRPRLLLIDELSLGLAPAVIAELVEVVHRIHERGVTVIIVEQSVNIALTLADKAVFMEKGEVRFFGETADLLARPDILRAVYVRGTGGGLAPPTSRLRLHELEAAPPALEAVGISKRYGGVVALDDVDLTLREGEVVGLIGPNGSGKTTLLDILSGYQDPDAGAVRYLGVDITAMAPHERAERRLVRRFQDARLFSSLTVFETLLVALDLRLESKSPFAAAAALPTSRRAERRLRARAETLVELLNLGDHRDKFVRELSTGLRRVVDLACVLANDPRVLLLDEPSTGIAQAEAEGLAPLLRQVRYETGASMLVIEHDMALISAVADELVALDRGVVLTRGRADVVLDDERVVASYLGGREDVVARSGRLL